MEGEFGRAGHGLENRWYSRGMGIVISALRHYSIDLYGAVVQWSTTPALQVGIPRTGSNPVSSNFKNIRPEVPDHPGLSYLAATSCEGVTLCVMHMCG